MDSRPACDEGGLRPSHELAPGSGGVFHQPQDLLPSLVGCHRELIGGAKDGVDQLPAPLDRFVHAQRPGEREPAPGAQPGQALVTRRRQLAGHTEEEGGLAVCAGCLRLLGGLQRGRDPASAPGRTALRWYWAATSAAATRAGDAVRAALQRAGEPAVQPHLARGVQLRDLGDDREPEGPLEAGGGIQELATGATSGSHPWVGASVSCACTWRQKASTRSLNSAGVSWKG
jgi:hypothetical protein